MQTVVRLEMLVKTAVLRKAAAVAAGVRQVGQGATVLALAVLVVRPLRTMAILTR
jgi:hypothetical protein